MARTQPEMAELKRVHRLMSRIYGLLLDSAWRLRYADLTNDRRLRERLGLEDTDCVGFCDDEEQILYVDHHEDVIATIVHECLHAVLPEAEEEEIMALEELVMRHMSPTQARRLHLIAGEALARR